MWHDARVTGLAPVVIVSGVPGAGKSTVARALAMKSPRSAHIEGDVIGHDFIVSGLVPPQGPPEDEALRQLILRRRNVCLLANSFVSEGFQVVIDDVVIDDETLDRYRAGLDARPLLFVLLDPDLGTVQARDERRDKHVFHLWAHLHNIVRAWDAPGLRIDTTKMTVDEVVALILAGADEARID